MPGAPRPFSELYLAGELERFFGLAPGDTGAAMSRQLERPRGKVAVALESEAKRLGAPRAALANIDRLAHPQSRAVVTGQQAGLLLGPAYTVSKAMTAIKLAARLDSEDAPVVPVFWVAAQDHDTEEIDHALLLDEDERLHEIALELPEAVAAGRIPFAAAWLEEITAGLARAGRQELHVEEAAGIVESAAAGAHSFADLFSGLLYRLLGRHGLIVLDPTTPDIAPMFRGVLERELHSPEASSVSINEAGEALRTLGLEPQLKRAAGATNLFLDEIERGLPRRRLLRVESGRFHTEGNRYDREDLERILCDEPWRLTPAAGLRPVAQDALLPTALFVVGPGELKYLAQLKGVYEEHGVDMPLAWPRAESVVLEPPVRRIFDRYGIDYDAFATQRSKLLERILLERHGFGERFEHSLGRIDAETDELLSAVRSIDPTLAGTVERGREQFDRTLAMLRAKSVAALAKNDEISRRQFDRLEVQLFPGDVPQERQLSPFSFLLKFGVEPMLELYGNMGESGRFLLKP